MKRLILTASLLAAVAATPAFAQQGPRLDDPGYLVKGPRTLTEGPRSLTKTPPPGQDDELPPPGDDDGNSDEGNGPGPGPSAKDRLLPPSNDKYTDTPPCLSTDQALARLTSQGWQEFHAEVVLDESVSKLRARRTDGQLYELTVNRCSAWVLDARPVVANYRTYAYTPPDTFYGGERYYGRWHGHGHWDRHSHWHRHRHCVRHGNHRHCHWHWHRNRHVHHHHRHHAHRHHHHRGHRFAHHHHHRRR